jgi:hypothetical protein
MRLVDIGLRVLSVSELRLLGVEFAQQAVVDLQEAWEVWLRYEGRFYFTGRSAWLGERV